MKKKILLIGVVGIALISSALVFISQHKKTTETSTTKPPTSNDIKKQVTGLSMSSVQSNNRPESCYVVVDKNVYNATKYAAGLNSDTKAKFLRYCGQDITNILNSGEDQLYRKVDLGLGNAGAANKTLSSYKIGEITTGF